jgi:hypothetical protein
MHLIVGVLAFAAAGIFLALSIPIDLVVKVETSAANKIHARFVCLFGLLSLNLSDRKPRRKQPARKRQKPHGGRLALGRAGVVLLTKSGRTAVRQFLRRILLAVKMRDFRLHVRFGFDDPADTGMLLAAAAPLIWLLRVWSTDRFSAEAIFEEEILCASGNMDVRIYPAGIIGAVALFILSPAGLRAAKAVFLNR